MTVGSEMCPACGALNDAATNIVGDADPTNGDVSICFTCGEIAVFTGIGLDVRRPTDAERREMLAIDEVTRLRSAVLLGRHAHRHRDPRPGRRMTEALVHLQTGSSTVRCGAHMRDAQHPTGWDLGNVTIDIGVTCPDCLAAIRRLAR